MLNGLKSILGVLAGLGLGAAFGAILLVLLEMLLAANLHVIAIYESEVPFSYALYVKSAFVGGLNIFVGAFALAGIITGIQWVFGLKMNKE